MASEKSILKLKGQLDGMSFYKNSEGYYVRAKGGIERDRIMNDKNFERTRENMSEFANINKAGKLVRDSIGVFMNRARDMRTGSRLVSLISKVKNLDETSARGERTFALGLSQPGAKTLLEGFEFNKAAHLSAILKTAYVLDTTAGSVTLTQFNPREHLIAPQGATHVTLGFACVGMNTEVTESETKYAEREVIPLTAEVADIALTLPALPALADVQLYYVLIEFLQEISGTLYPLRSGSFNALQLVKVV